MARCFCFAFGNARVYVLQSSNIERNASLGVTTKTKNSGFGEELGIYIYLYVCI